MSYYLESQGYDNGMFVGHWGRPKGVRQEGGGEDRKETRYRMR